MQTVKLGKTGYTVSRVIYGGIVSAFTYADRTYSEFSQADSDRYVARSIDAGVNYFDVAPTYGDAQTRLGISLAPYRRDVYLAVKTTERRYGDAEKEMKESLKLLKTDYFDTYQMHALSTMEDLETAFGPGGIMELMVRMKEKGLCRCLGFTAHSEAVAVKALSMYDFDSVLFPFNWHMNLAHGMGNELLCVAKEKNVGILCMKSMIERAWIPADTEARQKYPKSWCKPIDPDTQSDLLIAAIKYAFSLGVHTIVPPGNYNHLSFALAQIDSILSHPLTESDLDLLNKHLETVRAYPFFKT